MTQKLGILKTYAVYPYLKTLKNNNFLTGNTIVEEDNYGKITVSYRTENFRCVFSETSLISSEEKFEYKKRDTRFQTPSKTYTNFLTPIMSPYSTIPNVLPPFNLNKNEDIHIVNKIFTKIEYLMNETKLPENLIPQFIALTSTRIYEIKPANHTGTFTAPEYYHYIPLHIEGKFKLTPKHMAEYLHYTDNIDIIIKMMMIGVLPENIEEYEKLSEYNMPQEWVNTLYSHNIADHTQIKLTI
jgi:hypothetical protein